ncbi:P-loop containing nucleoside triphosphate hydrolase protein [Morchella snyderi]|nr:P-loop containing nucleoside triphosphate hydrolase protein [Morchella snyderi]
MSNGWGTMNDTSNNDDAWGSIITSNNKDTRGMVDGWVERKPYDYETYATPDRDPEAPRGEPTGQWAASGRRYEWKEEYGDVAPRDEALELMLFGELLARNLMCLRRLFQLNVSTEGNEQLVPISSFDGAKLHPVMLENIRLAGYKVPTPIQRYCIPAILEGHDILSCAQTGSGKTAAFLIPILSKLMGKAKRIAAARPYDGQRGYIAEPLVLIVAPTRELATQIFDECRRFCYRSMLRPCVIYGGADAITQKMELERGCDILVATPGRLTDFLERGKILTLKRLKFVVIDEADEMLDMGFEPQIRKILQGTDANEDDDQQVLMFSATFQKPIRKLAKDFLADAYVQIKVGRVGSTHGNITQRVLWVDENKKKEAVYDLLCTAPPARTLIFVNHKRTADSLDDYLYNLNLPTTSIHGDRTQREREDALLSFRSGKCPIMIATGVAARGLDIKGVMHVINYDLVQNIDEYIHRIGRTARIGNAGIATSFFNDRNPEIALDLVKVLLESEQIVPSFLDEYRPADGEVNFDEEPDTDEEEFVAGTEAAEDTAGNDEWGKPDKGGGAGWGEGAGGDATVDDGWN